MQISNLVICLGGGVRDKGLLPPYVRDRIAKGLEIVRKSGGAMLFSSSFTLNKPTVINPNGMIYSEASAMARYAVSIGYEGKLYCEQQSHDTIGSAYFIFSDFVSFLNPEIMTIVTSDFHADRAAIIFRHIADLFLFQGQLMFSRVATNKFSERIQKEQSSLLDYQNNWANVRNLNDFRQLLFETHSNYNYVFSSEKAVEEVLQSY